MLSISLRRRFGRPRFKYILEGNLARFRAGPLRRRHYAANQTISTLADYTQRAALTLNRSLEKYSSGYSKVLNRTKRCDVVCCVPRVLYTKHRDRVLEDVSKGPAARLKRARLLSAKKPPPRTDGTPRAPSPRARSVAPACPLRAPCPASA